MARAFRIVMALLVWHALDLGLICAFNFSLNYHITNDPSGVAFAYGRSTSVIPAPSRIQCGVFCLMSECAGFTYQDNICYLEGVGSEKGLSVVGPQMFRQWKVNRAFLKPVYATDPHYGGAPPEHAVNNHTCLTYSSVAQDCCYATFSNFNQWLVIDLEASMTVHVVAVGTKRLVETEVRVGQQLLQTGDFSSYELLGRCSTSFKGGYMKFSKNSGIVGRYVSIQQIGEANFFLCDVLVFADD